MNSSTADSIFSAISGYTTPAESHADVINHRNFDEDPPPKIESSTGAIEDSPILLTDQLRT